MIKMMAAAGALSQLPVHSSIKKVKSPKKLVIIGTHLGYYDPPIKKVRPQFHNFLLLGK